MQKSTQNIYKSLPLIKTPGLIFIFLVWIFILTACSSKAAEPASVPPTETKAITLPSATPIPPTLTPEPTATATATLVPTLGVEQDGFTAWCIPKDKAPSTDWGSGSYAMPEGAVAGEMKDGTLNLLVPAAYCTYVYTFNQALPPGTQLSIFDKSNPKPFFTSVLEQGQDNPNIGYAVPKHSIAYNPDFWDITVQFVVLDANNNELRRDNVRIHKILPPRCWDGSMPDPVDLRCPVEDR